MNEHRYILEPYKGMNTRYACPRCESKQKTFVCYIDTQTSEHVHPTVGRCNRESNCGYHYTPKQYFHDNNIQYSTAQTMFKPIYNPKLKQNVSFITDEVFKDSLTQYTENNFVNYLFSLLGAEVTIGLIEKYFIGTSKFWNGATVFWQIDVQGKIRTGKIMLYDAITGKRIKESFNCINWVHKIVKQPDFELRQCLFGEHLLCDKIKPIAIVESEKTAIIASAYLPQYIWLASSGLQNLNIEKCKVLKDRNVILFPDLKGFDKWESKMGELFNKFSGTSFKISNFLESCASDEEKERGLDIADYLIKFKPKDFKQVDQPVKIISEIDETTMKDYDDIPFCLEHERPEAAPVIENTKWNQEIIELEEFFKTATLPSGPFKLNQFETICDIKKFIETNISAIKAQTGNKTYLPYLERLQDLQEFLQ